jgi:hypothetical protein
MRCKKSCSRTEQEMAMGVDGGNGSYGRLMMIVVALTAASSLTGCGSTPAAPTPYAAVTCKDSLPSAETGPYRPGVVCLAYGESPTTGARSGGAAPAMKAINVDGRVFFVDARRDMPPEVLLHR